MAWVDPQTDFDADQISAQVLAVASQFEQHRSDLHCHQKGQLLYISEGYVELYLEDTQRYCLLPPYFLVWIAPQTLHQIVVKHRIQYHSLWFDASLCQDLKHSKIFVASPLLKALLQRLMGYALDSDWQHGAAYHLSQLSLLEIAAARPEQLLLTMPRHEKLLLCLAQYDIPPTMRQLASLMHMSEKTLGRIVKRETQMGYQQWRQHYRLITAIKMLLEQQRIHAIAQRLAFCSDSAFIAFFKQRTGLAPAQYLSLYSGSVDSGSTYPESAYSGSI
ncbi:AraC family transcriptional regulator [Acinetobacter larvae]|uniref:HTH araC/xylS-type domain-containing protein n=1 Tax=Acinetobacter larvae TaxID=1789224 RepID=A0A1B2LVZ5_9GAMM|nr:helix-turn-helix transcriptional regulator [Acinetobacter larvae]AOA56933.1 hypothetical protein BFG52_00200 [Acinetobacter larvae]